MDGQLPEVDSHSEERAAKRIKIDDAAAPQDQNGEAGQDTTRPLQNETEPTPEASKSSEANGEPAGRVKGMAPIKKE